MIEEIFLETSRISENCHSIPVIGTIWSGLGSDVDEEIILEGSYMSPKSEFDEEIILEYLNYPQKPKFIKI